MDFLLNNLGTIAVSAAVILLVGTVAFFMIKNKKSGKSSCTGGCADCPFGEKCGK